MTSPTTNIPRHVAVIMDGNGRWARSRGLPRVAGHRKGVERVRELVESCAEAGVEFLTVFAFSSENWRRPAAEVRLLTELFLLALEKEVQKLHANGIRLRVIGDVEQFGQKISSRAQEAATLTENNTRLTLTIAANYGGRWDIAQACRRIVEAAVQGKLDPASVGPESLEPYLSMSGMPEPDLFIRTGGEQRISNFLLWQLAYTELHFTPVLWPDFDCTHFKDALNSFAGRQRRFGQTGEQVEEQQSLYSPEKDRGAHA
ncbi:MAG: polyprenyl diphosphate synthase [Gammaproteobacteria bacterium]|nr:polyprenyl diphosphate synthase [Gammaproteobacteria bacterium]